MMNSEILASKKIKGIPFPFGLGIDHLWFFGVLAAFSLVVSLVPVEPHDFWWHLKIGEMIATTHTIPHTNLFAWSIPADKPFVYGEWLAEYLFYFLYRYGGLALVIFIKSLLIVVSFGIVGYEVKQVSGSWRIAGAVTMLSCAMATSNLNMRPQVWAWLPFAGMLVLLSAYSNHRLKPLWLFLCPIIMVFWVNVHGSFVLGIGLIGLTILGESLRHYFKQEGCLNWIEIQYLAIAGILSFAAILVNSQFTGIFGYVINLMTDTSSQTLGPEWQHPSPDGYATIAFYVSILVLILVFAYSRYHPTMTELLLLFVFLWLAWTGLRYVLWYSMVVMLVLGRACKELIANTDWVKAPPRNLLNLVLILILWLPVWLVQPWFIKRIKMPEFFQKQVLSDTGIGPMLSVNTPLGAAEYLRQHPGGRLFNEMAYGSYLIWSIPEQGVFIDTRMELYPLDQWMDYMKITNGEEYNQLLQKYHANRILINAKNQAGLVQLLENDSSWYLEYSDSYSEIWAKKQ